MRWLIAVLILLAAACSSDDEFSISQVSTTSARDEAGSSTTEPEPTSTTKPPTTTTAPEARVPDAAAAGEWVRAYLVGSGEYLKEGFIGDGLRFEKMQELATYWAPAAGVDPVGAHTCEQEEIGGLGQLLADDAEIEVSIDVTNVIEVEPGLWIVEYNYSFFITGFGDNLDSHASYVSSDGIIGGRPDDDPETDPSCWEANRTRTAEVDALVAKAEAVDLETP